MVRRISGLVSAAVIVGAVALGAGYWYRSAGSACPAPLRYSIGAIDERFGLSHEEALTAVAEAERLWEEDTGRELFVYDPAAPFVVNFVFDERQRLTVEEHRLRSVLDRKEDLHGAIREEYDALRARYETLAKTYEQKVAAYESALAAHNAEVSRWNEEGGALAEVYERLEKEQATFEEASTALRGLAETLNGLVDTINRLGEEGNETVREYNDQVAQYNDRFHHEREFTQGDFYRERINIYQFRDRAELALVLAHELGHALSLGHADDSSAVMYYLMEEQDTDLSLSPADVAEFERVCGK